MRDKGLRAETGRQVLLVLLGFHQCCFWHSWMYTIQNFMHEFQAESLLVKGWGSESWKSLSEAFQNYLYVVYLIPDFPSESLLVLGK